jgi:hypothetical protein
MWPFPDQLSDGLPGFAFHAASLSQAARALRGQNSQCPCPLLLVDRLERYGGCTRAQQRNNAFWLASKSNTKHEECVRRERNARKKKGKSFCYVCRVSFHGKSRRSSAQFTGRPTERAALRWRPTATAPLDLPMRPSLSLLLVSVAQGVARDPQASTSETRRAAALAQSKARKKRFIHVWKQNLWASAESRSGVGSERRFAADDRIFILDTVRKHFVGRSHNLTIVDAPCAIISWPRSGCALPCFHGFHREYSHQM